MTDVDASALRAELRAWLERTPAPDAAALAAFARAHAPGDDASEGALARVAAYVHTLRSLLLDALLERPSLHKDDLRALDQASNALLEERISLHSARSSAHLHDLEERWRFSIQTGHIGTWEFEVETGALEWSARTRELFGLSADEPVTYPLFVALVHPEDRARVFTEAERIRTGPPGERMELEYRILVSGAQGPGAIRWIHSQGGKLRTTDPRGPVLFGTVIDITERKRLAELTSRYEATTQATRQLLYDWNAETGEVSWAGRAEELLGRKPEEMPPTLEGYAALVHPDDQPLFHADVEQALLSRGTAHLVYRVRRADGDWALVEDNGRFFFDAQGRPQRMLGFIVDAGERKRLEEQRDQERRRAQSLAELDRVKTEFFDNVSHEFRTPLTLILGPLEDALLGPEQTLKGEALVQVHHTAVRMLRLVNSLLDFSSLEAGRLRGSFEPTELSAFTAELTSSFRSLLERAGLELVVDCPPLPEPLWVDRAQWEHIVFNLLSNAYKFTRAGRITVSLRWRGDHAELSVKDTGVGIPPDQLSRIFDRFHRVQRSDARSYEGSGIGLALVHGLVKLHGGDVRAVSTEGEGSTFTVTIPAGKAHLPQANVLAVAREAVPSPRRAAPYVLEASRWATAAPPTAQGPAHAQGAPTPGIPVPGGRILIADDNPDMRAYLRRLLAPHWTVEEAPSGDAALAAALAQPPDLLLADVMMPGLDGFALLRALRAEPRTRMVPVVLLSARAGEEAVLGGLEAGADDYLVKPFSARELLSRVRTHLQMTQVRRAAAEATLREQAQQRLRMLAEASAALGESLEPSGTLSRVARLAVPLLADWCMVDLVGEDGELHRVEVACANPADAQTAERLKRVGGSNGGRKTQSAVAVAALSTRHAVLADVVSAEQLRALAYREEQVELLERLHVRSLMAVPLVARGSALGVLVFASTHSERHYGKEELTLARELANRCAVALDNARLYKEAREAIRVRDEFLSIASHELRTPLTPLKLQLRALTQRVRDVARDPGAEEWLQARLGTLTRQEGRLERLVSELLDVSRLTNDRLTLSTEPLSLSALAQEVAARFEESGEVRRARSRLSLRVEDEAMGEWDRSRLDQVVTNLLSNALKFGAGAPVELTVSAHAGEARLVVRDHGIGIALEDRRRIFQRFERAVSERHYGGMGLGLWIVRQIIQAMGGSIDVDSRPGEGATFTVRLPQHPAGDPSVATAPSPLSRPPPGAQEPSFDLLPS